MKLDRQGIKSKIQVLKKHLEQKKGKKRLTTEKDIWVRLLEVARGGERISSHRGRKWKRSIHKHNSRKREEKKGIWDNRNKSNSTSAERRGRDQGKSERQAPISGKTREADEKLNKRRKEGGTTLSTETVGNSYSVSRSQAKVGRSCRLDTSEKTRYIESGVTRLDFV